MKKGISWIDLHHIVRSVVTSTKTSSGNKIKSKKTFVNTNKDLVMFFFMYYLMLIVKLQQHVNAFLNLGMIYSAGHYNNLIPLEIAIL